MIGNGPFMMDSPGQRPARSCWCATTTGPATSRRQEGQARQDHLQDHQGRRVGATPTSRPANVDDGHDPVGPVRGRPWRSTATRPSRRSSASYYFDFGFDRPAASAATRTSSCARRSRWPSTATRSTRRCTRAPARCPTGITPPGIPGFKEGICKYCTYRPGRGQEAVQGMEGRRQQAAPARSRSTSTPAAATRTWSRSSRQNLKDLGIDVDAEPDRREVLRRPWPTAAATSAAPVGTPTTRRTATSCSTCSARLRIGGNNLGSFYDPKFDDLVAKAQAELDDTKRAELYQQAEDYLLNTATATVPINWYTGDQVYADKVVNYDQPPLGIILWERVGVKK